MKIAQLYPFSLQWQEDSSRTDEPCRLNKITLLAFPMEKWQIVDCSIGLFVSRNSWSRNPESSIWSDNICLHWGQSLALIGTNEKMLQVPPWLPFIRRASCCLLVTTIVKPPLSFIILVFPFESLHNVLATSLLPLLPLFNISLCILSPFCILTEEEVSSNLVPLNKTNHQVLFGNFSWFYSFFFLHLQPFWFQKLFTLGLKEGSRIT